MNSERPKEETGSSGFRVIKIGLLIFLVAVIGLLVLAWIVGDQADLPFDYEGFD